MLQITSQKIKKIYRIGLRECIRIVANRRMIKRFAQQHKKRALAKKAATTWDQFSKKHPAFSFKKDLIFLDALFRDIDQADIITCANNILKNKLLLFGQEITFEGDLRWHTDFLLKQEGGADCSFDPELYFNDIVITAGKGTQRVKDIRVVWELSRLHLLMPLGKAYALTHNKEYADYCQQLITDWHHQNPYLLGVNWVCPMEVGIRAINLIIGFTYFKYAELDQRFKQQFICLLYDHMCYLEHTWEYYDGRTSNHYLSDLVGYFYLAVFFEKKCDWVVHEILRECDKQVAADGMSYEGSTAYHLLVTELFALFHVLCEQEIIKLPQAFHQKYVRMCDAIQICKINDRDMITVGDNDSGKVLWTGISAEPFLKTHTKKPQERTDFDRFGLTVIKKEGWQVSLRDHVYRFNQPSGHFHNDVGSVTLALNGIPILVDPGSYCYTASTVWRNYFRSASVHNAVSLKGKEPVAFDAGLFALNLPEAERALEKKEHNMKSVHRLYEKTGFNFERSVEVQKSVVVITDFLRSPAATLADQVLFFNFTFAAEITLEKNKTGWLISYKNEPLCILESDLDFKLAPGWVSYNYGSKIPTVRLCSEVVLQPGRAYVCRFERSNSC